MTRATTDEAQFAEMPTKGIGFRRFTRVMLGRKLVLFGVVVITMLLFSAIFAPVIAPYNPYTPDFGVRLQGPSWRHPLGTDGLGRDTLSRIIYGSRTSLVVGLVAVFIASAIGMVLGLLAGYFGGIVHAIIMRCIDALMSIPLIMLSLAIASLLGGGLFNIVIALGVAMIPAYARVMCGQALSVKQNDYVLASRAMGASNVRTMLLRVAPNCFPPLLVIMTMQVGIAILAEAGLSFLGVGVSPPQAAWGSMVSEGYKYLNDAPMLSFAPGLAIILVVFSFNMVGDGLRDALDPRLRGII
ncbi:MAG: ABC transporter permease [Deltaproteobacteria bacterium]|nr:ABC transporter permease [Deltaproteobacteria bacterium]